MPNIEEAIQRRRLQLAIESRKKELEDDTGASSVFGLTTGRRLADNALAFPRMMLGSAPAAIAAAAQGVVGSHGDPGILGGGDFDFSRRFEEQQRPALAEALFNLPTPTSGDVGSFARAAVKTPGSDKRFGELFREEQASLEEEVGGFKEDHPIAFGAGEIAGDALTLATGRTPLSVGSKKFERWIMNNKFLVPDTKRIRDAHKVVLNSKALRATAREAGRSLETGLEAATLDLLKNDDPMETAVYAAAGQLTGGLLLRASQGIVKGGLGPTGMKVAAASVAAGSLWQVLKDMTPGGRDSLMDSIETGYEKVTLALVLGGLAGLGGAGRFRGDSNMTNAATRVLDAVAALPRGGMISILEKMVEAQPEQQQTAEAALSRLAAAPGALANDISSKLSKSLENGTFVEVVSELEQTNQQFRDWLNE